MRDCKGDSAGSMFPGLKNLKDEDLLKEFESSVRLEAVPESVLNAPSSEFESIWLRIQDEKELLDEAAEFRKLKRRRCVGGRWGWKRIAAIGVIACFVVGIGFVIMSRDCNESIK